MTRDAHVFETVFTSLIPLTFSVAFLFAGDLAMLSLGTRGPSARLFLPYACSSLRLAGAARPAPGPSQEAQKRLRGTALSLEDNQDATAALHPDRV